MTTPNEVLLLLRFIKQKRNKSIPIEFIINYEELNFTKDDLTFKDLIIYEEVGADYASSIQSLPDNMTILGDCILNSCWSLRDLPKNLKIKGILSFKNTYIDELPDSLEVGLSIIVDSNDDIDDWRERYPNFRFR